MISVQDWQLLRIDFFASNFASFALFDFLTKSLLVQLLENSASFDYLIKLKQWEADFQGERSCSKYKKMEIKLIMLITKWRLKMKSSWTKNSKN